MRNGFIKVAAASPEIKVAACNFNALSAVKEIEKAKALDVKLLVLPELCLSGYTCGDLFRQTTLLEGAISALDTVKNATIGCDILVFAGLPFEHRGSLYNCAAAVCDGHVIALFPKTFIPNYSEFYEMRHFSPAPSELAFVEVLGETVPFGTKIILRSESMKNFAIGCEICEDLWIPDSPSVKAALAGATVVVNLSASNEVVGKPEYRKKLVSVQSSKLICAYIYSNAGSGESSTDMVFSAHSLICENGSLLAESEPFLPSMIVSEIDIERLSHDRIRSNTFRYDENYYTVHFNQTQTETSLTRHISPTPFVPSNTGERNRRCQTILKIQAAGLQKRIEHIGCKNIVVGISGGLDSSLALLVMVAAMDNLGRDRKSILAVTMPCFGTTKRTRTNAEKLCEALGVSFTEIDITKAVRQHFIDIGHDENVHDVTYQNAQARERTQVLMDIANKNGGIVIGTGDLSELALGWATYNGDHMSMYGVNASVPKTLVRHLVSYYSDTSDNKEVTKTLLDILDTPVSPELIPPKDGQISQVTEELVGPYELHDFFLYYFVRFGFSKEKIKRLALYAFKDKYGSKIISKWLNVFCKRFFTQQFKRSCLPDGAKVGSVALSPRGDWRMPSDASDELWNE